MQLHQHKEKIWHHYLTSKTRFQGGTRQRREKPEGLCQGRDDVPVFGKASGQESQGHHHDSVLCQDLPPPRAPSALTPGRPEPRASGKSQQHSLRNGVTLRQSASRASRHVTARSVPLWAGTESLPQRLRLKSGSAPLRGRSSLGRGPPGWKNGVPRE